MATETGSSADYLIWKSDGTPEGTVKVVTSEPTDMYSEPDELVVFNGRLIFVAERADSGRELWSTDGTQTGTQLIADVVSGPSTSNPRFLTACEDMVFFLAEDPNFGEELFVSDGTPEGTYVIGDVFTSADSGFSEFAAFGELLLFRATNEVVSTEIWRSDGTALGTGLVADLNDDPKFFEGSSEPRFLTSIGQVAVYSGATADFGIELMRTDASAEGTFGIKNINPDSPSLITGHSFPKSFYRSGTLAFFSALGPDNEDDLWRTDGTGAGTILVLDAVTDAPPVDPQDASIPNGYFVFGYSTPEYGRELWISDGTALGTELLVDHVIGTNGFFPRRFALGKGKLIFNAVVDSSAELWAMNVAPVATSITRVGDVEGINESIVEFSINFNENVTGVDASDFLLESTGVSGASIVGVAKGIGESYLISVDPGTGDGTIGLSLVDDNSILDLDGLALGGIRTDVGDLASDGVYVIRDVPEVTLTSTSEDPTEVAPIRVDVFFSEAVSGFALVDISVSNGGASGLIGADQSWSFDLTPDGPGVVTAQVVADSVLDSDSNGNLESNVFTRTYTLGGGEGEQDGEGQPEGDGEGTEEGQVEGMADGEGGGEGIAPLVHASDQNGDNAINLSELLRVIQFFNSDGFGCEAETEDGYAPNDPDQTCAPHTSDYNPQDWEISLSELLRLIQFFNSDGYSYCPEQGTEDGFCPG